VPAVAALILLSAGLFVACDDDDGGASASGSAIEVLSALEFLDNAGFHDIDDSINGGEIPATAANTVRRAQAVVELASWPDELEEQAAALGTILADFATELEKESPDVAATGELATRTHDGAHEFSSAAWAYLQDEAGIEGGGDAHD